MAAPTPLKQGSLFDTFWLDKKACPGITKIKSGGNRAAEWQDQQIPGTSGATSVFRFEKVGMVTYEITVWNEENLTAIRTFVDMIEQALDARPVKVFKLVDLRFAHNRIHYVSPADIGAELLQGDDGRWTYSVQFKQVKPKKPFGGPVKPPQNSREKLLNRLTFENGELNRAVAVHDAYRSKKKGK